MTSILKIWESWDWAERLFFGGGALYVGAQMLFYLCIAGFIAYIAGLEGYRYWQRRYRGAGKLSNNLSTRQKQKETGRLLAEAKRLEEDVQEQRELLGARERARRAREKHEAQFAQGPAIPGALTVVEERPDGRPPEHGSRLPTTDWGRFRKVREGLERTRYVLSPTPQPSPRDESQLPSEHATNNPRQ